MADSPPRDFTYIKPSKRRLSEYEALATARLEQLPDDGALRLIEINTLPGLTPSTVLFHQALAEQPPLAPRRLLEHITDLALRSR